jgi:excinuclease ABC subunit A
MKPSIDLFGARQNNLKNLDVSFKTGELTVITGVSGSGKSSLAFDTLYAEGQRRYVETFSPYARQFLDRMDKPQVDRIEGILPAIAIDQTNPVRNSRSTVGTMTEVNDHLKLLFARGATLYCRGCGKPVHRDSPQTISRALQQRCQDLAGHVADPRLVITFEVRIPANFSAEEVSNFLQGQGYTRIHGEPRPSNIKDQQVIDVVQDRFRWSSVEPERLAEALEQALRMGQGMVSIYALDDEGNDLARWRYSNKLHCADCELSYQQALPSTFSFNSPLGACETCRGFGRIIGIDLGLVIPDESKTLEGGAIKPWQTPSFKECQDELEKYAKRANVSLNTAWRDLPPEHQQWVLEGDPLWKGGRNAWQTQWYGVHRFFEWLETKAYKMHVRVMLSKYRSYTTCPSCHGTRLKPDALLWKVGGRDIHELMCMPISDLQTWFKAVKFDDAVMDTAMELVLQELNSRLKFVCDVGLGYLTLDRQSRTLSGGEVQRINLTTALGTSLVNTLFVLDEPSIGLHPRDMNRVVEVMHRLRTAGNTLVVVEHDPQVMVAADRIIDIGPGPGERGGQIVFDGTPEQLRSANTLTGQYMRGAKHVQAPRAMPVANNTPRLLLEGVTANNLKNIDLSLPLGRLVCLTGVSGSGKSTLVQNVLHSALLKLMGRPTEAPGAYRHLLGQEQLADVVMVDQSPIGKTARSNPASYVGVFDAIRKLFAQAPLARERSYTAGTFSFNSGDGRCPTCGGTGFEHVEMQFLSDVYLRCPDCDGKRFRPEIREVRIEHLGKSASIDEVLDMTVSEAMQFFQGLRDVQIGLAPLADVGLEYVKLGQPVPTLSGGEAQRLKLAGHLAEAARSGISGKLARKGSLFLFDEPTTGLHFDDVARLMRAFRKLLGAGHSLLIIEHNLDVIRAADWVIDLGPEAGEHGGQIVAAGPPAEVMTVSASHTGQALRDYEQQMAQAQTDTEVGRPLQKVLREPVQLAKQIEILHAREHNLQNISVQIPHGKFTVITGVSGSGKSTLAFDILFNEGQRRYLESLNAYARAIVQPAGKPDVDAIYGIAPTVAIEQRTSRGGRKSTVATMTEIHHFLRLLYMKLGTQHCPECRVSVEPQTAEQIAARIVRDHAGTHIGVMATLVSARKGYYTDLAKWASGKGYTHLRVDGEFIATGKWPRLDRYKEHTIELPVADFVVDKANEAQLREAIETALHHGQGNLSVVWPLDQLKNNLGAPLSEQHFSTKRACPSCGMSFPEPDPRLFSYNSKHGWCTSCYGTGLKLQGFDAEQTGEENAWNASYEGETPACESCHGTRLNPIARAVIWRDRSIAELAALPISEAQTFFTGLVTKGREAEIARDILQEVRSRLDFLREVGLSYLALDRAAPTLSGGEAQRIRLAAQLGSNLQGVCYVLDEPTIGLHPRDNQILLNALSKLERNGNTLVVVEHDDDTIRRAQHIIDIGPGAGVRGGQVVACGNLQAIMDSPESVTGRFLREPLKHPLQARRVVDASIQRIEVKGARLHNLQLVDAAIPVGRMTVITGVSGSGKSTFAREVLLQNMAEAVGTGQPEHWFGCEGIDGWQAIDRVLEVDQTPIGKTPRSCPATYIGFWDDIRKQFADTQEARMRGWKTNRFSFNTGDGRCPVCEGQGMRTVEMSFLPDVKVPCDACHGDRFNADTLSARLRGKHVGEVLAMEVDDAVDYFAAHPKVAHPLKLMQDVGLGYLTLGQPSPTLSGGEAQRIKLVTELAKAKLTEGIIKTGRASRLPHTLYVLDEPTVGLSMADVEKLIDVLHRLTDSGNTVVVIEHNLDVIAEADWVIDLGPEGGSQGGRLVAQGSPETLIKDHLKQSHTAQALKPLLEPRH